MTEEDQHPTDAGTTGRGNAPDQTPGGAKKSEDSELESTWDHSLESQQAVEESIGSYRIVRQLGEGGMGTVYLGIRSDMEFKKSAAIKVIRKGMDSQEIVARFHRERQILSSLDHPNIARLLDGGTTKDGLPYFVMEYIQGKPLTEYCDSHKLTTNERLELFRLVCSAVQYAHRNLVVHRDLKPANILVAADGTPKLLDFGIAKILNPDVFSGDLPPTATGMGAMTPDYASPEQAGGEPVTTSSDVYSLGVILYELLAGRRPYRFTSRNRMEIFRIICEQEPARPSTAVAESPESDTSRLSTQRGTTPEKLRKELNGDLDNIILMALRKEPQRRYSSVEALSEDISRYLEGHPVHARKGTWSYRTGKYIRRNKAGVAGAAAILLLVIAFALTVTFQNVRISEQRDSAQKAEKRAEAERLIAEEERLKAIKVTDFLAKLFEVNDPAQSKGETLTAREILDRGADRLHKEFKDQPEVQAELMDRVGMIYEKLGMYDQAELLLKQSLGSRQSLFGSEHVAVAQSLRDVGQIVWDKGQYEEAERLLRQALSMHRKLLGEEHLEVAADLRSLGGMLRFRGQLDEAEKLIREALVIDRKRLGNEHLDVVRDLSNLAGLVWARGQLGEAEKLYRDVLAIHLKLFGNEHPAVASDLNNLGTVLFEEGRLDEAEKLFREAAAVGRKLLGSEHPQVAGYLGNLARALEARGQLDEAEKLYRDVLAMRLKLHGKEHPSVSGTLNDLAGVLRDEGRLAEAEKLYRESIVMDRKLLGNAHPKVAWDLSGLAGLLKQEGRWEEAEESFREALAIDRKTLGNGHPDVTALLVDLAEVLLAKGETQNAVLLAKEALDSLEGEPPAGVKLSARAKSVLGDGLTARKRFAEAEPLLLDAYKIFSAQDKAGPDTKKALQRIIHLYQAWGKPEKAAEYRKLDHQMQHSS